MICSREYVIKKMAELMIKPKNKYSQNFLTDYDVVKKSVDSLNLDPQDVVLEIGPGLGALSEEILNRGNSLYAFEIDENMISHLQVCFAKRNNFHLIPGDFLKQDLISFCDKDVRVISNIPYSLTTPIIEKVITAKLKIKSFVFMIQKEVSARLNAKINTKEYSPLSIMIDFLGKLEVVTKVNRDKFIPSPNVDSIVLKLTFNQDRDFNKEKKLFSLLKNSFAMRRKTILNNLTAYLHCKEKAETILNKANILCNLRPEQLSLKQFIDLMNLI